MIHYQYKIVAGDFANAGKVSSQVKNICKELGVSPEVLRKLAVACYEAEINMIIHSDGGNIVFDLDPANNNIVLCFADVGPGIADIEKALTPGFSTATQKAREFGFGAGMGLPNIKKMSDEFSLTSSSEGSTLITTFNL